MLGLGSAMESKEGLKRQAILPEFLEANTIVGMAVGETMATSCHALKGTREDRRLRWELEEDLSNYSVVEGEWIPVLRLIF